MRINKWEGVKKYMHQMQMLLWKNYTIKKRSVVIFVFEITVPLVLFLMMVTIRSKQNAVPLETVYYNAWPLPTAGFIPVMQSFCNAERDGVRNEYGILEYPNATAKTMMKQIDKILASNWTFDWFQTSSSSLNFQLLNNIPDLFKTIHNKRSKRDTDDDLQSKLDRYVQFQKTLDDLSQLAVYFPTGLCGAPPRNITQILDKTEEDNKKRHERKPKSLIAQTGDPEEQSKIIKNFGFIGLWNNMQKTFCGVTLKKSMNNNTYNQNVKSNLIQFNFKKRIDF
jgi:hypothetical protein